MTAHPLGNRIRVVGSVIAGLLAVAASALAPAGVYAERVLFQSEAFAETIAPLRSDPGMQDLILTEIGKQANTYIDELSKNSGPLSGLVDEAKPWLASAVESSARHTMASDAYEREWDAAVREAHAHVLSVLNGTAASTGTIVFPAGKLADLVAQDAMSSLPFTITLPHMTVNVPLVSAESVARYQSLYTAVHRYGYLPLIIAVVAGALAIALARKRLRTVAVLGIAVALIAVVGALIVTFMPQHFVAASQLPTDIAEDGVHLLLTPLRNAQWILAGCAAVLGVLTLAVTTAQSRRRRAAVRTGAGPRTLTTPAVEPRSPSAGPARDIVAGSATPALAAAPTTADPEDRGMDG